MNFRYRTHSEFVLNWSKSRTAKLSEPQLGMLFETAVKRLWDHAHISMSGVLLAAILDRVMSTCLDEHKILIELKVTEAGIDFSKFRDAVSDETKAEIVAAMRLFLVEFIAILGNLTNEVIIPGLYDQLSKVSLDPQLKVSSRSSRKNGVKK